MSNAQRSTSVILHREAYGRGDPILCLHGMGGSTFSWRHFIAPFSKNHKLILVDFRGCGKSPKPHDKHYSIHDHADSIYQLILEDNLTNLTIMGNSLGGAVALILAIRLCAESPARLARLILIDSGGDKRLPAHLKLVRSFLGNQTARRLNKRRNLTRFGFCLRNRDNLLLSFSIRIGFPRF